MQTEYKLSPARTGICAHTHTHIHTLQKFTPTYAHKHTHTQTDVHTYTRYKSFSRWNLISTAFNSPIADKQ